MYPVKGTNVKKKKPFLTLLRANYISLRSYFISGVKAGLHKKKMFPWNFSSQSRQSCQCKHPAQTDTAAQTTQRAQAFSYLTFCMPRKYISVSHGKGGKDGTSLNLATQGAPHRC